MQEMVFASTNRIKRNEVQAILATSKIRLRLQEEFNIEPVEETGLSFIENSILKARHASKISGLPAIADDSGIIVDILDGAPGIYSARFAGVGASSRDNNNKLLKMLENKSDRSAKFYCVIAYVKTWLDPMPLIFEAAWHGEILHDWHGQERFGYDPIFYVPTHNCSATCLSMDEKNKISHRGQALEKFKQYINNNKI